MGSKDLYCCPLCYTAAYNCIGGNSVCTPHGRRTNNKSKSSNIADRYKLDIYKVDPISILTEKTLDVASTFCFNSAAKVKKHLINDHQIDKKSVKNVSGNELYKRFQVRRRQYEAHAKIIITCSFQFELPLLNQLSPLAGTHPRWTLAEVYQKYGRNNCRSRTFATILVTG